MISKICGNCGKVVEQSHNCWKPKKKNRPPTPVADRIRRRLNDRLDADPLSRIKCQTCPAKVGKGGFIVDHVEPLFLGGPDHVSNIQVICRICSKRKTGWENSRK